MVKSFIGCIVWHLHALADRDFLAQIPFLSNQHGVIGAFPILRAAGSETDLPGNMIDFVHLAVASKGGSLCTSSYQSFLPPYRCPGIAVQQMSAMQVA